MTDGGEGSRNINDMGSKLFLLSMQDMCIWQDILYVNFSTFDQNFLHFSSPLPPLSPLHFLHFSPEFSPRFILLHSPFQNHIFEQQAIFRMFRVLPMKVQQLHMACPRHKIN
jgi:hypothetical protein